MYYLLKILKTKKKKTLPLIFKKIKNEWWWDICAPRAKHWIVPNI